MYTILFYFRVAAIILFSCFFIWMALLLLGSKTKQYEQLRKKLNPMILSLLFGIVLLNSLEGSHPFSLLKVIAILGAVFLSAIGLKRKWKTISTIGVLLFVAVGAGVIHTMVRIPSGQNMAQTSKGLDVSGEIAIEDILAANKDAAFQQGKVIYKVLCVECHGEEGQKEALANLTKSKLSLEENMKVIAEGRGTMPGYSSQLSEQEINLVAAYTETLK